MTISAFTRSSIVMAEGDPATRQPANLVLLNSDFNDVPEILLKVVGSPTLTIFLLRRDYSFILAIICNASASLLSHQHLLIFPFIPIQITLIDQFVEGFPSICLNSFERTLIQWKTYQTLLASIPYQMP